MEKEDKVESKLPLAASGAYSGSAVSSGFWESQGAPVQVGEGLLYLPTV